MLANVFTYSNEAEHSAAHFQVHARTHGNASRRVPSADYSSPCRDVYTLRCENNRVHQMGGAVLYTRIVPRRSAEIPWQQCDSLVLY